MKKFFNSNKTVYIILCLVILAGICRFSYGFFVEKQGTHSDEEWSFGLANSYYEPYIYSSDDDTYDKNCNEWLSGEVLKNYLTVQKGERFSFGSVYYNMACDMHPPLYFFALHFLSSFFVDQYIPALGFIINVVCYIIMSIFLYRLLLLMSKSRYVGILGVIFNTFNVGTLSMVIFIRMYTMVTMFAVILAYYNAKLYYDTASRKKISTYIKLAIFTCLGALTHHFFLPYAFMLTAVMCICWMVKKEWHVLAKYAGFMILGVALSIAIFPATLDHMLGVQTFKFRDEGKYTSVTLQKDSTQELSNSSSDLANNEFTTEYISHYKYKLYKYYYLTCFYMIFSNIFGFSIISPFSKGILMYLPVALGVIFILILALSFLLRNESFFKKLKKKICHLIKNKLVSKIFNNFNWYILSIIATILFIVLVCCLRVNISLMADYSTRYLFIIYPLVVTIFIYFLFLLLKLIFRKRLIYQLFFIVVLTSALCINIIMSENNCPYFFKSFTGKENISKLAENSNIIIISPNQWHMTVYAPIIYNCANYIYIDCKDFLKMNDSFPTISTNKDTYLILDSTRLLTNKDELSTATTFNNNNVNVTQIIMAKNKKNNFNTDKYFLNNYLDHLLSFNNIQNYTQITDAVDFGIKMKIYKIEFRN